MGKTGGKNDSALTHQGSLDSESGLCLGVLPPSHLGLACPVSRRASCFILSKSLPFQPAKAIIWSEHRGGLFAPATLPAACLSVAIPAAFSHSSGQSSWPLQGPYPYPCHCLLSRAASCRVLQLPFPPLSYLGTLMVWLAL